MRYGLPARVIVAAPNNAIHPRSAGADPALSGSGRRLLAQAEQHGTSGVVAAGRYLANLE
jgi:hypothetical protein